MKKICFLYTETTGLHNSYKPVSKKELYNLARMVSLNYEIGYLEDSTYIQEKAVRIIAKPRTMFIPKETEVFHNISQELALKEGTDPEEIIHTLKNDLEEYKVSILVSHNVDFHLKTILGEVVRYNVILDVSKYIIIDTVSFYHSYGMIKLKELATKLKVKDIPENTSEYPELIRNVFFKLYKKFTKENNSKENNSKENISK